MKECRLAKEMSMLDTVALTILPALWPLDSVYVDENGKTIGDIAFSFLVARSFLQESLRHELGFSFQLRAKEGGLCLYLAIEGESWEINLRDAAYNGPDQTALKKNVVDKICNRMWDSEVECT